MKHPQAIGTWRLTTQLFSEETDNYVETSKSDTNFSLEKDAHDKNVQNRGNASILKRQLYQLAASYDRGFGATSKARKEANDIIQQLAAINPTINATLGIDGDGADGDDVPLRAIWRMVWTSALDVVSLAASPIAGELLRFRTL